MLYEDLVSLSRRDEEEDIEPFPLIDDWSEKSRLAWLTSTRRKLWDANRDRGNEQITNEALFRGQMWNDLPGVKTVDNRLRKRKTEDSSKLTVPDVYHYVETLAAKMQRLKPGVLVSAYSNEYRDREGARIAKAYFESVERQRSFHRINTRIVRRTLKWGESFLFMTWDKDAGDYTERWQKARDKYGDKKVKFKDGFQYNIATPERVGDIKYDTPLNWMIFFDPAESPEECQYVFTQKFVHQKTLIHENWKLRKKIEEIEPSEHASEFDEETGSIKKLKNCLPVIEFWHRKCDMLPDGYYMRAVPGLILEEGDNPYSSIDVLQDSEWGDLPLESMRFIEHEGSLHSDSAIQLVVNLLHAKNLLLSMCNRNLKLFGTPKFLVHKEAKVNFEALTGKATIVSWAGNIAPQVANYGVMPDGVFKLYELLMQEADKIMRSHPISSGNPPAGITAGVALRLLEEIEDIQLSNLIEEQRSFVLAVARRMIAYAGANFKKEDGRFLEIMGNDKRALIEEFDPEVLQKRFNFMVEPISNQARSPAARQQQNVELLESLKSNPMAQERVIDAMEMVKPEKLTDPAVAAVSAAESIYELCAQNKELPTPREGENFIVFWEVLMAKYQERSFTSLPEKAQERFRKYLLVMEFLMDEQARRNPAFAQQVMGRLLGFPAFYQRSPAQQQPMPMPQSQQPQQQAAPKAEQPQEQPAPVGV